MSRNRKFGCHDLIVVDDDLAFTDVDSLTADVNQATPWTDIGAEHGMRRLMRTSVAFGLTAFVIVLVTFTTVASAESWLWWRKTESTAGKGAPAAAKARSSRSFGADEPISQQYATTPTLENRQQVAPTNTVTIKEPAKEHWWERLRVKSKKTEKREVVRDTPRVKDQVPVVVEKDPPPSSDKPSFVRNSARSNQPKASFDEASDDDLFVKTNNSETTDDGSIAEVPGTKSRMRSDVSPRLQIGRIDNSSQRSGNRVKPVVFDSGDDRTPVPPVPDLRLDVERNNAILPFEEKGRSSKIQLRPSKTSDELISLTVRDAPLSIVLSLIAEQHGLNLVAGSEVDSRVTVTLNDVELDEALNALLTVNGYSWHRNRNILVVSKVASENRSSPMLRGVVMRVFRLNYISAVDVEKVVTTLLSPAGRAVTTVVDIKSTRRTREEIVVEDLPEYVERIEAYIAEVDRAPRQVLIEAHVLQINLKDNCLHGVNLQKIIDIGNTQVSLQTTGFANPLASPAFFFGIDNNDFHLLVQALTTQTDSKTLATPRVLCLNGQHAKIHIGEQLGFLVTTTTQTSTLQNVNFLNVGVILDVTPVITEEGLVMLHVKPEVSGGQINPNGLPSATTTEVETTVMLADGTGMIIGGLIKEEDTEVQTKIPYLGDIWLIGRLFQQRTVLRQRNEIIIALIPHILPHPDDKLAGMDAELRRVQTRLLSPPLERMDRREWEPDPPDAIRNPKHLFSGEILRRLENPYGNGIPLDCEEE